MLDILTFFCLLLGSVFLLVGVIGIFRMPDFFTRLHAASIIDTLGVVLIMVGLVVQAGWSQISVKLFLISIFVLFTSPVANHAMAKSALRGKHNPMLGTGKNE